MKFVWLLVNYTSAFASSTINRPCVVDLLTVQILSMYNYIAATLSQAVRQYAQSVNKVWCT